MFRVVDFGSVTSIMDLGAGGQYLKSYLPAGMDYNPGDIKQREGCGKTIVVNFNNHEFPECNTDCMFCAGILEYLEYPQWWIRNVC